MKDLGYLPHEKQIHECVQAIQELRKSSPTLFKDDISRLEMTLQQLRQNVYERLTAWDRVLISRHAKRPRAKDYIRAFITDFFELHGDRAFGDDRAIIGGLGYFNDQSVMIIGQEKGSSKEEQAICNFGMMSPEGFRKALRLMKLAERLHIPIITLLDTPGAYPGLEAEQRGQGWVIAENLREMFSLRVPMVVVIIGEGCSGGALGIGIGDRIAMLEHSYYAVISPEGCASILWKDAMKRQEAAAALRLNAEHMYALGIVHEVLQEPLGGAHYDVDLVYASVRTFISTAMRELQEKSIEDLLQERYALFRSLGSYS